MTKQWRPNAKSVTRQSGAHPAKSGGGITSNVNVRSQHMPGSSKTNAVNPGRADEIGNLQVHIRKPPELETPRLAATKLGNETALEAGQGPGAGRKIYGPGSQGQHN